MNKNIFRKAGFIAGLFMFVACTKTPVVENLADLSRNGTANCYVLEGEGSDFFFDATVCGNGKAVSGVVSADLSKADHAVLIWQSGEMIKSLGLEEGKVRFSVNPSALGNALLGIVDKEGEILWSWHIWRPAEKAVAVGDLGFMNLNLGAIRADAHAALDLPSTYGLMYQWGRKDPFPGSPVVTGDTNTQPCVVYDAQGNPVAIGHDYTSVAQSIAYSIAHPTTCISYYGNGGKSMDWLSAAASNDGLWGNGKGKTCFDPCPPGWMVPGADAFVTFSTSGTNYTTDMNHFNVADINGDGEITFEDYAGGWYFKLSEVSPEERSADSSTDAAAYSFFPAAARYDAQYAMLMGSMTGYWGNYWTSGVDVSGMAIALGFSSKNMSLREDWTVTPKSSGSRAYAFSVRCVAEK